jgi:hypothetical protein
MIGKFLCGSVSLFKKLQIVEKKYMLVKPSNILN